MKRALERASRAHMPASHPQEDARVFPPSWIDVGTEARGDAPGLVPSIHPPIDRNEIDESTRAGATMHNLYLPKPAAAFRAEDAAAPTAEGRRRGA